MDLSSNAAEFIVLTLGFCWFCGLSSRSILLIFLSFWFAGDIQTSGCAHRRWDGRVMQCNAPVTEMEPTPTEMEQLTTVRVVLLLWSRLSEEVTTSLMCAIGAEATDHPRVLAVITSFAKATSGGNHAGYHHLGSHSVLVLPNVYDPFPSFRQCTLSDCVCAVSC